MPWDGSPCLPGLTLLMSTAVLSHHPDEILVFRAGGQLLALALDQVREIFSYCALSCPPAMPAVLQGLLNLGGESVPVVRLTRLLGLPDDVPGLYSPMILVSTADSLFAFQAEAVCEVSRPPAAAWCDLPRGQVVFNGCVTAEVRCTTGNAHLVNPSRLLLRREREAVMEFADTENRRMRDLAGARP